MVEPNKKITNKMPNSKGLKKTSAQTKIGRKEQWDLSIVGLKE
ncbi:MAG: hypothetical protein PVF14_00560 [Desulfobacterales bacterium]|jgi:hypothetical protein